MRPSPSRNAADHSPRPVVNRDASHSFAGRDNDGCAQRARAGHDGSPGSAGRRHVARHLWPDRRSQRRSRRGPDRSGCRSRLVRGSGHRGTAAPGSDRPRCTDRAVDDGRGKSCDIAPACVPRHGVVHGAEAEPAKLGSAPCLPPIVWPRHRRRQPGQSSTTLTTEAHQQSDAARGSPSDFMAKLKRRQFYADSDRHRHQGGLDLPKIAEELERLRNAMKDETTGTREEDKAIGAVADAEDAAAKRMRSLNLACVDIRCGMSGVGRDRSSDRAAGIRRRVGRDPDRCSRRHPSRMRSRRRAP